jgi:hypothetical protein
MTAPAIEARGHDGDHAVNGPSRAGPSPRRLWASRSRFGGSARQKVGPSRLAGRKLT